MKHLLWATALLSLLSACGEQPQTLGASQRDAPPSSGTGKAFAESGWKQGDKASWESHLKARSQYGQNDYGRMN